MLNKPSEVVSTPSPRWGLSSPVGRLWRKARRSCLPQKPNPTNQRQGGSRKRPEISREVPPSELLPQSHGRREAMKHSQHGPLASSVSLSPNQFESQLPTPPFAFASVPADVAALFDSFGRHRAACFEARVLGGRGYRLECAMARVQGSRCQGVDERFRPRFGFGRVQRARWPKD